MHNLFKECHPGTKGDYLKMSQITKDQVWILVIFKRMFGFLFLSVENIDFKVSFLTPQTCNLTIKKSYSSHLNSFEKSFKRVSEDPSRSSLFCSFFIVAVKQYCNLKVGLLLPEKLVSFA